MNYIGSKFTLLPFIEQVFREVSDGSERMACDIFAGTGAVGRLFKRLGLRVIANDLQYYAYALNKAYIEINDQPRFTKLRQKYKMEFAKIEDGGGRTATEEALAFVNSMPGAPGFIAKNYSPSGGRFYYSEE